MSDVTTDCFIVLAVVVVLKVWTWCWHTCTRGKMKWSWEQKRTKKTSWQSTKQIMRYRTVLCVQSWHFDLRGGCEKKDQGVIRYTQRFNLTKIHRRFHRNPAVCFGVPVKRKAEWKWIVPWEKQLVVKIITNNPLEEINIHNKLDFNLVKIS